MPEAAAPSNLLGDEAISRFIERGWLRLQVDGDGNIHDSIERELRQTIEHEAPPGNNLLARIPAIWQVLRAPVVHGALTSLLVPNYLVHPHRAIHSSTPAPAQDGHLDVFADGPAMGPGSMAGSRWHQDAQSPLARARHHLPRYLIGFYFPHDVPLEMGPTRWQPGTQYDAAPGPVRDVEQPSDITAGTLVLLHFDMVHAAFPNRTAQTRYMLKFVFARTQHPSGASWRHHQAYDPAFQPGSPERYIWDWLRGASPEAVKADAPGGVYLGDTELDAALNDVDASRRLQAIYAHETRASVPALARALANCSGKGRSLRRLLPGRDGRPGLRDDVSGDPRCWTERAIVMEGAAYALAAAGPSAVSALTALLDDSDPWVQLNAAFALGEIGPASASAQSALCSLLHRGDQTVVRTCIDALGAMGVPLGPALPAFSSLLIAERPEWNQALVGRGWTARDQIVLNIACALLAAVAVPGEDLDSVQALLLTCLEEHSGYAGAVASEGLIRLARPEATAAALQYLQDRRWDEAIRGKRMY